CVPHIVVCLLLVSLLLAAACSGPSEPLTAEAKPAHTVRAQISTVRPQVIDETLEAVGTVQSLKRSLLSSKLVATIVAVHAAEGERVRAGQVVVDLDDRDVKAQLTSAEASLRDAQNALEVVKQESLAADKTVEAAKAQHEFASATLTRYQTLLQRHSVAPQEYEEVGARAKMAAAEVARAQAGKAALAAKQRQAVAGIERVRAELASAQVSRSYTKLTAPFDGIVVAKSVEVGNMASPGVPLLTIEEERYRLEVAVQESEVRRLRVGQPATVHIEVLEHAFPSTVSDVVPTADPLSRTFIAKLTLPAEMGLRSGLYGKAQFVVGTREAIVIPRSAVRERGQLQGVFVLDQDHIASWRLIKTGKSAADQIEVLAGLAAGERLVVDGSAQISDGSRVAEGK
ncbi:MAG: efflux RND transporter periplasmic adaptor subunit, partial [Candidatus Binatia bacterium]